MLLFLKSFLTYSALAAEVKLGPERIGARTDGGLQIFLPHNGSLVAWAAGVPSATIETQKLAQAGTYLIVARAEGRPDTS